MKTQKQLLILHRASLDAKFHKKYPNGQFVLQLFGTQGWSLHWCPKRNTSWRSFAGVSTYERGNYGEPGPIQEPFKNSSFGKCRYFRGIKSLLEAAENAGVPTALNDSFLKRYFDEGGPSC